MRELIKNLTTIISHDRGLSDTKASSTRLLKDMNDLYNEIKLKLIEAEYDARPKYNGGQYYKTKKRRNKNTKKRRNKSMRSYYR